MRKKNTSTGLIQVTNDIGWTRFPLVLSVRHRHRQAVFMALDVVHPADGGAHYAFRILNETRIGIVLLCLNNVSSLTKCLDKIVGCEFVVVIELTKGSERSVQRRYKA